MGLAAPQDSFNNCCPITTNRSPAYKRAYRKFPGFLGGFQELPMFKWDKSDDYSIISSPIFPFSEYQMVFAI